MRVAVSFCQRCSCAGCRREGDDVAQGVPQLLRVTRTKNRFKLVYHTKINIGSVEISARLHMARVWQRFQSTSLCSLSSHLSLFFSFPFSPCLSLSLILIVSRKRATRKGISVCFFAPAAYKANCSQWQRHLKLPCCMQQLCTVISSCLSVSPSLSPSLANCRH